MAIHRAVHENLDFYFVAEDKIMLLNIKGLCQKKIGFQHKLPIRLLQGRHFPTA